MSIRSRAVLLSFILVALLSLGLTSGVTYQLQQRTALELASYRDGELEEVRNKLKSLLDVAYVTLDSSYHNIRDRRFVENRYGHRLRNVIDIAKSILGSYAAQVEQGDLSLAEAQAQALADIRKMRYDDGTGYVWVNDTGRPYPRMLMHPTLPALEGKIMDDPRFENIAVDRTKQLFTAFLDACDSRGEGFVDYIWPKPTPEGMLPDVPKLSYVSLFKEWGWIVGTGIYLDDIERDALEQAKADIRKMRYDEGTGYFWVNDTTAPHPVVLVHPLRPDLEGKPMAGEAYAKALDIPGRDLGQAFVEAVARGGAGYVEYNWPRPDADGPGRPRPKLAYLRLYEPLGWIIGTGVYIDDIEREIAEKQDELESEIAALVGKILWFSGGLFVAVSLLLSLWLKGMLKPLLQVNRHLQVLAQGRLTEEKVVYRGKDEIAGIIHSFLRLREKIRETIRQAQSIAAGDYTLNIQALAKTDQLGMALAEMTRALRSATAKNAAQDWLKTGQTRLHERMRGEQSVQELAEHILEFLTDYLQAQAGLFYLAPADAAKNEGGALSLLANHGCERRKKLANRVSPGRGLVGQAALEKQIIAISETDNAEDVIEAEHLLAVPFFHEGSLKGVIELGSGTPFGDTQLEFLELVVQDIGIAVHSAQSRMQLQALLQRNAG